MKLTIHDNWHDGVRALPREAQDAFYGALARYAFDGEEPGFQGIEAAVWAVVRPFIDKSAKAQESGAKGGNGRGNKTLPDTPNDTLPDTLENPLADTLEKGSEKGFSKPLKTPPTKLIEKNIKEGKGRESLKDSLPLPTHDCEKCGEPMRKVGRVPGSKKDIWKCQSCLHEVIEEVA